MKHSIHNSSFLKTLFRLGLASCLIALAHGTAAGQGKGGDPDPYGYGWVDSDEGLCDAEWIDISGSGQALDIDGDDEWAAVTLGFTFNFYGVEYDELAVGSNGFIAFSDGAWRSSSVCLPDPAIGKAMIAPLWTDQLCMAIEGEAVWFQEFELPSRYAVIQYHTRLYGAAPGTPFLDYQVIIHATHEIEFIYHQVNEWLSDFSEAVSIGIQSELGDSGLSYFCDGAPADNMAHDDLAICFGPAENVFLSPMYNRQCGLPDETIELPGRIENRTGPTDSYDAAFSGNDWPARILVAGQPVTALGPIAPGEGLDFVCEVDIPADAAAGESDSMTLAVVSQYRPDLYFDSTTIEVTNGLDAWGRWSDLPARLIRPSLFYLDDAVYLTGGGEGVTRHLSRIHRFDATANRWLSIGAPDPEAGSGVAYAATDSVIYAIGGFSDEPSDQLRAFHLDDETWETFPDDPLPAPFGYGGAVVVDGKVYVLGGMDLAGSKTDEVRVFDPEGATGERWTPGASMPVACSHFAATGWNGGIVVSGGRDASGDELDQAEWYDPVGDAWTALPALPMALGEHRMVAIPESSGFEQAGALIVTGGGRRATRSAWVLGNPDAEWAPFPSLLERRAAHAAVFAGDRIIVAGGRGIDETYGGSEAYLPRTIEPRVEFTGVQAGSAIPGEPVEFELEVTNRCGGTTAFEIVYAPGAWPVDGPETLMEIEPGETVAFTVSVAVPGMASWFETDQCVASVTATQFPGLSASKTLIATAAGGWSEREPLPAPRAWITAVSVSATEFFVLAGEDDGGSSELWAYDALADQWASGPASIVPVSSAAAAAIGEEVYLIGGLEFAVYQPSRMIQIFDPRSELWSPLTEPFPGAGPIGGAAVSVDDGLIYLGGGDGLLLPTNEVWRWTETSGWEPMAPMTDDRMWPAIDRIGDYIMVAGGLGVTGPLTSVEIYDLINEEWTLGPPLPAPVFAGGSGVDRDGWFITGGHGEGGANPATWRADLFGGEPSWQMIEPAPQPCGYFNGSAITAVDGDRYLHLLGGWDADGPELLSQHQRLWIGPPDPSATPTPTATNTPLPTATPTPPPTMTSTPPPTSTSATTPVPPTATPPPSVTTPPGTPTPTPEGTPPGTRTPTPQPTTNPPELGVVLEMPSDYYRPGDPCRLNAILNNPGPDPLEQQPLVVMLDIGIDEYWFYPSWNHYPPDFDFEPQTVPPDSTTITIIPEFTWPDVEGAFTGITFRGALLDHNLSTIIGQIGAWEFGYGN